MFRVIQTINDMPGRPHPLMTYAKAVALTASMERDHNRLVKGYVDAGLPVPAAVATYQHKIVEERH